MPNRTNHPLKIDLTGETIGRLKVIDRVAGTPAWRCRCECGAEVVKTTKNLRRGTRSCGCLQKEIARARATKHGLSRHPLYFVLSEILQRCENPSCSDYKYYGDRGVSVCEDWHNPVEFIRWAEANGYEPGLTIDRINTYGNYEPDNCRWVTIQDQQRNRRQRTKKD